MAQTAPNEYPAYVFAQAPSHALSIARTLMTTMGKDKPQEWRDGVATALLCIETGLRRDGILPKLHLLNRLHELSEANAALEAKVQECRTREANYRRQILDFHANAELV